MSKIAVVTGSSGFIGTHLLQALNATGWEVRGIDTQKPKVPLEGVKYFNADIQTVDPLKQAFKGADVVFHLAALPRVQYSIDHPLVTFEVNAMGTQYVFYAAKEMDVARVVYAASSSAYGDQDTLPLTEDMPHDPKSPYGMQKFFGEEIAKQWNKTYGLESVSLRYFNVYGPGANDEGAYALVIAKFLKQRRRGEPMTITGDGEQTRDFTHVRDVVRATILAAESPDVGSGEVINIGAGTSISVNRIAELIGGPTKYIEARFEPRHTRADNAKARALLGWEPAVSIEEGIEELKQLYKL